ARCVVCGTASVSSWDPWPTGHRLERHVLVKRASIAGFLLFDYVERFDEARNQLAAWISEDRLRWKEHVLKGIEAAPGAISMLYRGENRGKLVVKLG
ncbi:MAG: NADP-dependent oxidoreductase, partial [Pseudomonadota bacterium]